MNGRARPVRSVLLALASLLVGWVVAGVAGPAAAHAELDHSSPANGAVLPGPPSQLVLTYSEAVQVAPGGVTLLHANGTAVGGLSLTTKGPAVTVAVPAGLSADEYVVRWRALSDDGHVVQGTFTFTVAVGAAEAGEHLVNQSESAPAPAPARTVTPPPTQDAAPRVRAAAEALGNLGVALMLGGLVLWLLVRDRPATADWRPRRQVLTGAVLVSVGALIALAAVVVQTAAGTGGLSDAGSWRLVADTASGRALLLRLVVGVGAAVLLARGRYLLALPLAVVAAVAVPLAGHATSDPTPALAVLLLSLHVVAAAVWTGAVVALCGTLRPGRRALLRTLLPTVGWLATAGVAVLVLTGVLAAWRRVPDLAALTDTGYGVALLVKGGLLVALVLLGGLGLRAVRGQARGGGGAGEGDVVPPASAPAPDGGGVAVLVAEGAPAKAEPSVVRRTLPLEVLLLTAALTVAGVLATLQPPARAPRPAAAAAVATSEQVVATSGGGQARLSLRSSPGSLGLTLTVTAAAGSADDVVAVLTAAPAGTVIPPTPIPLQRLGPGSFTADPVALTPAGLWQLTLGLTHADGRHEELTVRTTVS